MVAIAVSDEGLRALLEKAGVDAVWRDVDGNLQTVANDSLRRVLAALGIAAGTPQEIAESKQAFEVARASAPKLITTEVGAPVELTGLHGAYHLSLESGRYSRGMCRPGGLLPAVMEPGYHKLEMAGEEITVAVAPRRAFTVADAARGQKLWGLAVQLYALRGSTGGGLGDFAALAEFVQAAAGRGADAVAISPIHAQFASDLSRFSPYAPSNRAALNVFHIAEPAGPDDTGELVDWQGATAAKLASLRQSFENFSDNAALQNFRASAGLGLERHALYEAIQEFLGPQTPTDWRDWPAAYQNPDSPTVRQFARDHTKTIDFHAYLQYRANQGIATAQNTARAAGMKIGLIADLAVGTDPAGSHSWSRQTEVLRGLEIGAPPDAINRQGQSWGITAFSPIGLHNTGYSAFIEMLRHALRHAGGVRIDHVMGLARLWVIPHGCTSAQGAYLRMPVTNLIRLIALESHRHKAIILGEDLGTLPEGFQSRLDAAGIAGLRVLWFEKTGQNFNPPAAWSPTAVAMTTTHDLPTVAGWWRGNDIAWRTKLGMAGEDETARETERTQLWNALQTAGAATTPQPAPTDGAKVADAACAFLGATACTLALLPIEDAIGATEQPNLPGTLTEHPNWRRRLPTTSPELLAHPETAARLTALNNARKTQ